MNIKYKNAIIYSAGFMGGVLLVGLLVYYATLFIDMPTLQKPVIKKNANAEQNMENNQQRPDREVMLTNGFDMQVDIVLSKEEITGKKQDMQDSNMSSVKPTNRVIKNGKLILSNNKNRNLPDIIIHSTLGIDAYYKAIASSGAQLVIYAESSTTGAYQPTYLLDKQYQIQDIGDLSLYMTARPLFQKILPRKLQSTLDSIKALHPQQQLSTAFVLPRDIEFYKLGALYESLGDKLFEYSILCGQYFLNNKKQLVLKVTGGATDNTAAECSHNTDQLATTIYINYGLLAGIWNRRT